MQVTLPAWAERHPSMAGTILVDPDKFYPEILGELRQVVASLTPAELERQGATAADAQALLAQQRTKYWIEVAYQCMKLELQTAMRRFNFTIHIRGDDGRSTRWGLRYLPGTDADVLRADRMQQAREWFRRLRGFIPG